MERCGWRHKLPGVVHIQRALILARSGLRISGAVPVRCDDVDQLHPHSAGNPVSNYSYRVLAARSVVSPPSEPPVGTFEFPLTPGQ